MIVGHLPFLGKLAALLVADNEETEIVAFRFGCVVCVERIEQRRFRMNLIVRTERPGFGENGWVGHELRFGDRTRINVALLDPRCVMTTLAQDDLPQDTDVLRTLANHNKMQVGDLGQFPCAGVYAVIAAPGTVRTGDQVTIV